MNNEINHTDERKNPFFAKSYGTPHDTAPFNEIRLEDYEPAFMEGIRQDDALTEQIINNPEPPTFDNTIAFNIPDNLLGRVSNVFFNLLSAETNDEMDALAQKMSPILTEHANNILLNEKLFARVKAVYEQHRELSQEEQMLLEKTYDGFIRSGANLSAEDKDKLRAINTELAQLTLQFSQNNLKETNLFQLHITAQDDLSG
ncbi:MAG: peptidase M3, partial [Paraprevotella sp.]|nr:peptidase M3 [Paraprevotella sp.]